MRRIFDGCVPRAEVLSGELRDEMFAARLKDVVDGTAAPVYGDPRTFFENTYPTEGLKTLVHEVLGRLTGKAPSSSPFIRLETSFGGGKTHNLIALYHLASGSPAGVPADLVDPSWIPTVQIPVAGISGWELDPANGVDHGDVVTRTLWGEIAWHLGKATGSSSSAYAEVRSSDEQLVAPGGGVLDKIVGDGPALIMLDEVARYLRVAAAVPTVGGKSNLAEQTVAFLMTLIEFATSKPKVALVLTLADSTDAFSRETEGLRSKISGKSKKPVPADANLADARKIAARQERVLSPAGEKEIPHIVTHRLFLSVDLNCAKETAIEYQEHYRVLAERQVELPERAVRAEYMDEMVACYPFHPELLSTLTRKTSTIPNFQKTRGALRLLARVVRRVWEEQPADAWLIAPHSVDLGVDDIVADLTSRLERPAFRSVVEADIASAKSGHRAHAQVLDQRWIEAGKPPYAQRAATTIFLHSLSQGIASGVEAGDLFVSLLQPGDDPQLVGKALSIMLAEEKGGPGTACWFMHFDGRLYRFKTEPALEKVVQDEASAIGRVKTKAELDERIRKVWKKRIFRPVYFPSEPVDLDDDAAEPKLAVLHYDAAACTASKEAPPELVAKLFDLAGSLEGFRRFKNNVFFLCADADQVDRLIEVVQRYLAIQRIVGDADRLAEFSEEQRKQLKAMHEAAELDVRVAITRAYRYVFYPSADAPKSMQGLQRETLPAQDQGKVDKDQAGVLIGMLRQLQKVLTGDDPEMPAAYVKAKAWPAGKETVTTADLQREFCRRTGLKLLLDPNQLKKTIRKGCEQGVWIYFDAAEQLGYSRSSPAPLVQFSEDALLYTLDEAARLKLKVKGEKEEEPLCPLCGSAPCVCGDTEEEEETEEKKQSKKTLLRFSLDGVPAQVFQGVVDRFHDERRTQAGTMSIKCQGLGADAAKDARSLGLAIPQLGKGEFWIEADMTAEFGGGSEREEFRVQFSGTWSRYKRLKQVTDAFGTEATKVTCALTVRAVFADGLDVQGEQFAQMRDIFTSLELGRLLVEVEEKALPDGGGT